MLEKYLTPRAAKVVRVIGLGILPAVGNPRPKTHQKWATWDYVDRHSSRTFLKIIAFANAVLLLSATWFFGNNFIMSIKEDPTNPLLLAFLLPLAAILLIGPDTARLVYYLHTSRVIR